MNFLEENIKKAKQIIEDGKKMWEESKQVIDGFYPKILVLSGGGLRGFYTIGVLKGIEEYEIDKQIKAVFGVSIGSIVGSLRCNGMKAQEIFDMMYNYNLLEFYKINFFSAKSILKVEQFKKFLKNKLPKNIEDLPMKMYVGCADIKNIEFKLFDEGPIDKILYSSMALPAIFPSVDYKGGSYVDGGVINNFPVQIAKKFYPKEKVIGIRLNNVKKGKKINNMFENLGRSLELLMEASSVANLELVDVLFAPVLDLGILDVRKNLMKESFEQGYKDSKGKFSKLTNGNI